MFRMFPRIINNVCHRPATRMFPAKVREPFATARGTITFDIETCKLCSSCANACPAGAIHVNRAEKKLEFEPFRCIACAACIDACKFHSVHMRPEYRTPAKEKSEEVNQKVEQPKSAAATA